MPLARSNVSFLSAFGRRLRGALAWQLATLAPALLVACLSSGRGPGSGTTGGSSSGSGDTGNTSSGGSGDSAACAAGAIATFPSGYSLAPEGILADATGLVFQIAVLTPGTTSAPMLQSRSPGGQPKTLFTGTPPFITGFTADTTTAYVINYDGSLSSVPRAGGAVEAVTASHVASLHADATHLYGIMSTSSDAGMVDAIASVPKTGGTPTVLYTGSENIGDLYLDGSTLYWVEFANTSDAPSQVMSAPLAATLSPTTLATVPAHVAVLALAASAGTVVYTTGDEPSLQTALDVVPPGGTPEVVAQNASDPIAIVNGVIYYNSLGVIRTLNLDGSRSSVIVDSSAGGDDIQVFAVDPSGKVYFGSGNCLYQAP